MSAGDEIQSARQRARQRNTAIALGCLLIVTGLVVLFLLKRIPLPMRIMVGLGDVFAGCVLLVLVRQKFQDTQPRKGGWSQ